MTVTVVVAADTIQRMNPATSVRRAAHVLTGPARRTALPVVRGAGRGLRVRFGESTLSRTVRTGEGAVEDAILGLLGPNDVVYDIGANIGWYSLLAARRMGHTGRVLAFEPDIANAREIQRNAATNRLESLVVVPAAVSDRDGWATFLDKGSLMGRLDKDDDEAQAQRRAAGAQRIHGAFPVPVITLDRWIAETGQAPPTVIKVDIEGAEIGALRGMRNTLETAKPVLIIELHGTRDAVLDLLDAFGYEHEPIECDGPTRSAPWWAHVLARPSVGRVSAPLAG